MEQIKEFIEEESIVDDSFFNVIMHNDDVTPFEYVIMVLNLIFEHPVDDALKLTMHIHQNGSAIVATLPMDEAYKLVEEVDKTNERYHSRE